MIILANKTPKSDLQVELTVKTGGLQVVAKGTITQLANEIEAISAFTDLASSKLSNAVTSVESETTLAPGEIVGVDIPAIKASKSTTENVRALFVSPWGKLPRSLNDVQKALEVNGVPDSPENISPVLLNLVRGGELRRIKKGGKWTYFRIPA